MKRKCYIDTIEFNILVHVDVAVIIGIYRYVRSISAKIVKVVIVIY